MQLEASIVPGEPVWKSEIVDLGGGVTITENVIIEADNWKK